MTKDEQIAALKALVKEAFEEAHYLGNRAPIQSGEERWATVERAWEDSESLEKLKEING